MRPSHVRIALCLAAVQLAACGLLGGDEGPSVKKDPGSVSTSGTPAPALAGGRSPVPKPAEWSAVPEVTVKGSSALGCETKMVREWVRISCRGKNSTGGTPTTVVVQKGGGREIFTFASGGITSLVYPFEQGTHVEATFSWTNVSHKLVSTWPRGAPKPTVVGVFEGAASPLDMGGCIDCMDEEDEQKAKAQGKSCCNAPACQTKAHCGGKVCCASPIGGRCRSQCNLIFEGPTCTSNAECPVAYGTQMTCQPHPTGLRSCQGP